MSAFHIRFRDINVTANGSLHGCRTVDFSVLATNVRYAVPHIHVTLQSAWLRNFDLATTAVTENGS